MIRQDHIATDSRALLRAALSDLVTAGLAAVAEWAQRGVDDSDDSLTDATSLLGVSVDASADEIRAAFRRCVKERMRTDGGFHDRGGDTTDPRAQELIDAKNLLLERARETADVDR